MKKLFLIILFLILHFTLNSCSNDNAETVEIATNTFECEINGIQKKHITSSTLTFGLIDQVVVTTYPANTTTPSDEFTFSIILDQSLPQSTEINLKYFDGTKWYFSSENFTSKITYRNTTNKIIKGTFSGTLEESFTSNTKEIIKGSFNIKY